MLITRQNFTLTLILYLTLAFTLAGSSEAKSFAGSSLHRREHANLKRMFKKRAPLPQTGGGNKDPDTKGPDNVSGGRTPRPKADENPNQPLVVLGAGSDPANLPPSVDNNSGISPANPPSSNSNSPSSSASPTPVPPKTESNEPNVPAVVPPSSTSSTSTSSTPSSTSTTSSSIPTEPVPTQPTVTPPSTPETRPTITKTASVTAGQPTETLAPATTAAAKKKSNVAMVLIAIAASVGGVVILWTIFRKWKLAHSSKFDQRLQPIDWQPTNPDDSPSIHRRVPSDTSFQSGSLQDNMAGRGVGGYGTTGHGADLGHGGSDFGQNPLPEHDFTANANLAPVGGYADLARGPSPQPQMQQALGRGPSLKLSEYEVGVPLHHQTGYAEAYDYNGDRVRF